MSTIKKNAMDGSMDGQTNRQTNELMGVASYSDERTHLLVFMTASFEFELLGSNDLLSLRKNQMRGANHS